MYSLFPSICIHFYFYIYFHLFLLYLMKIMIIQKTLNCNKSPAQKITYKYSFPFLTSIKYSLNNFVINKNAYRMFMLSIIYTYSSIFAVSNYYAFFSPDFGFPCLFFKLFLHHIFVLYYTITNHGNHLIKLSQIPEFGQYFNITLYI